MAWKSEVMRHKIMTLNCSAGIVVFFSIWTSHMVVLRYVCVCGGGGGGGGGGVPVITGYPIGHCGVMFPDVNLRLTGSDLLQFFEFAFIFSSSDIVSSHNSAR